MIMYIIGILSFIFAIFAFLNKKYDRIKNLRYDYSCKVHQLFQKIDIILHSGQSIKKFNVNDYRAIIEMEKEIYEIEDRFFKDSLTGSEFEVLINKKIYKEYDIKFLYELYMYSLQYYIQQECPNYRMIKDEFLMEFWGITSWYQGPQYKDAYYKLIGIEKDKAFYKKLDNFFISNQKPDTFCFKTMYYFEFLLLFIIDKINHLSDLFWLFYDDGNHWEKHFLYKLNRVKMQRKTYEIYKNVNL